MRVVHAPTRALLALAVLGCATQPVPPPAADPAPPTPRVHHTKPGELPLGVVSGGIGQAAKQLDACYLQLESDYTTEPPERLVFTVVFDVQADGRVREVAHLDAPTAVEQSLHGGLMAGESSTGDEAVYDAMHACVSDALGAVAFPASEAGSRAVRLKLMYEAAHLGGMRGRAVGVVPGMTREAVRAVIEAHVQDVRACLRHRPGGVTATWTVDASGTVTEVRVEPPGGPAEGCFRSNLKTWEFPPPIGGGTVEITYSFE